MDVGEQPHGPPDGGERLEDRGHVVVPLRARDHRKRTEAIHLEELGQEHREFRPVAVAHAGFTVRRDEYFEKRQSLFSLERGQILLEVLERDDSLGNADHHVIEVGHFPLKRHRRLVRRECGIAIPLTKR